MPAIKRPPLLHQNMRVAAPACASSLFFLNSTRFVCCSSLAAIAINVDLPTPTSPTTRQLPVEIDWRNAPATLPRAPLGKVRLRLSVSGSATCDNTRDDVPRLNPDGSASVNRIHRNSLCADGHKRCNCCGVSVAVSERTVSVNIVRINAGSGINRISEKSGSIQYCCSRSSISSTNRTGNAMRGPAG